MRDAIVPEEERGKAERVGEDPAESPEQVLNVPPLEHVLNVPQRRRPETRRLLATGSEAPLSGVFQTQPGKSVSAGELSK